MDRYDLTSASREILWNVSHPLNSIVMYLLFAASMVVCGYGLYRRVRLWAQGRPDPSRTTDYFARLGLLWKYVAGQRKVNRKREVKIFHTLVLWGFMVLLFTTTMVFIDHDLGIDIYRGRFYLAVTLLSDLFGLGLLLGIAYAFYIRFILAPDRLHSSRSDWWMLALLALLCVQGFMLEGMRIYVTEDPWARFSPVGWLVSATLWSLSPSAVRVLHALTWWAHTICVFVAIALLPYTKFLHILTSSANLYFQELRRPKGALRFPGDIEQLMETAMETGDEDAFAVGVAKAADLTWKQRLDLDACTSCGRCQEVCPAYNSGKALSPKWLILDTRNHMLALETRRPVNHTLDRIDTEFLAQLLPYGDASNRSDNELVNQAARAIGEDPNASLAGEVMDEDVFWACTSCRACMEVCPVGIEHVDLIMDVRRSLTLMQGAAPAEAQPTLRAIETRGNPFGPADQRASWSDGLAIKMLEPGDSVEVLYWVGCISAYDKRKQKIARSLATILNASGISWGILGNREHCTGDPARRLGEENLFQTSAKKNIETLRSIQFKTVVANCPHCFNTIKNEYPQVGSVGDGTPVRIVHHSAFIMELIDQGRLAIAKNTLDSITFHDPCYLGRYNDTYDAPRDVLVQIGATKISEMRDTKEHGLCCGAGGGHYWFDMKVGERVNVQRVEQAAATDATTIATACPFCLQMMEDGVKLTERTLEVRDIAELVADALQPSSQTVNQGHA